MQAVPNHVSAVFVTQERTATFWAEAFTVYWKSDYASGISLCAREIFALDEYFIGEMLLGISWRIVPESEIILEALRSRKRDLVNLLLCRFLSENSATRSIELSIDIVISECVDSFLEKWFD